MIRLFRIFLVGIIISYPLSSQAGLDEANAECTELGFEAGSDKHSDCVLALSKSVTLPEKAFMVCETKNIQKEYAPDKKLYWKIDRSQSEVKIFFRTKSGWQLWCDEEYYKSKSSSNLKYKGSNFEFRNDGGNCTRQIGIGSGVIATLSSSVDFSNKVYKISGQRSDRNEPMQNVAHMSECLAVDKHGDLK